MTHSANAFNLVDEAWIPIAGKGLLSLREVFSHSDITAFGGNSLQKIALFKLFLAIAQAAHTPKDEAAWASLGPQGMAKACLAYLDKWRDAFWLYGEKPFLQMPIVVKAEKRSFGTFLPHISTGNTTLLFELNKERTLNEPEKAMLILSLMGLGLGGKKVDNSIILSPGYTEKTNDKGKVATGKPGTNLGFLGYLHHFIMGESLHQSIWFNMLTTADIQKLPVFSDGVGTPPWERMPQGEDCAVARSLKASLMGRLVPMSKFPLLVEDGMHCTDGVLHPDHKSGGVDPSIATNTDKALWSDPEKQPWRNLPALLAFLGDKAGMSCLGLRVGLLRAREHCEVLGIWAGGLRVSSNAGEQYVSGTDDFVESFIQCSSGAIGEHWFANLENEMLALDALSKTVYAATRSYAKELKDNGEAKSAAATNMFWQLCHAQSQNLIESCASNTQRELRQTFAQLATRAYNIMCPHDTARQLETWAKNTPNMVKYMSM